MIQFFLFRTNNLNIIRINKTTIRDRESHRSRIKLLPLGFFIYFYIMHKKYFYLFSLFLFIVPVTAQTVSDTSNSRLIDSLQSRLHFPSLGSVIQDSSCWLSRDQISKEDYVSTPFLFDNLPGLFLSDLGSPGQQHFLTMDGLPYSSCIILIDGVPISDPQYGAVNFNFIPSEFIDHIEYSSNGDALTWNNSAGVLNIVTKTYATIKPYTKLRYFQASNDHLVSDGIFSQNISRQLNFMAAFQNEGTSGRFFNSDYSAWNLREKLQWKSDGGTTLILTHIFNQGQFSINGGVNVDSTQTDLLFDENRATLMNLNSYEKQTRHDIYLIAGIPYDKDTIQEGIFRVYYNYQFREYWDGDRILIPTVTTIRNDYKTERTGISYDHEIRITSMPINISSSVERLQNEITNTTLPLQTTIFRLGGLTRIESGGLISMRLSGGYQQDLDQRASLASCLQYGTELHFTPVENFSILGGINHGPSFQWLNAIAAGYTTPSILTTFNLGVNFRNSFMALTASLDHKLLSHWPIPGTVDATFAPIFDFSDREKISLVSLSLVLNYWHFVFENKSSLTIRQWTSDAMNKTNPLLFGNTGFYFDGHVVGQLDARAGFRLRYSQENSLLTYNWQTRLYSYTQTTLSRSSWAVLDAVLVGKIGSAILSLTWENLTDENYYIVPFYPMQDRQLRISLSWEFLD